jgi:type VI secretion system protein ImpK
MAGEKFYEDLQELLSDPQTNYATLETFFYCLSLGFQGQYLGKTEEREKVIHQLATVLIKTRKQTKPPRKKTVINPRKQQRIAFFVPTWAMTTLTIGVVLIIWFGTSISIHSLSNKPIKINNNKYSETIEHF